MNKAKIRQFLYGDSSIKVDKKEVLTLFLGASFMFYGVLAISFTILRGKPSSALWLCYASLLFIGIGVLRKNSFLIAGFLHTVLISLVVWNIDFIIQFITGDSFWGVTDFFFKPMTGVARFISLEHFFLIPIALWLLSRVNLERNDSWKLSIFILFITTIASLAFTDPAENVNCAFKSCVTFMGGTYYQPLWMGLLYFMAFLSGVIINRFSIFFSKEFNNKRKSKR